MEEVKKLIAEDPEQILDLIRNIDAEETQRNPARKIVAVKKSKSSEPIQTNNKGRPKKDRNAPKREVTPRTAERLARGREKLRERNEFMRKAKELERKQKLAKESEEVNNIVHSKISEKTTSIEERIKRLEDGYMNMTVAKSKIPVRRKKVVSETETDYTGDSEIYVKKKKKKKAITPKKRVGENELESDSSYVPPKVNIADIRKKILNDPYFNK